MTECLTPWNLIWNAFHPHQCSEIYGLTYLSEPFSFTQYLPYFLKTFILELPVYFLFFKCFKKIPKILEMNFILNLSTHPVVFFVIPYILMKLEGNYLNYLVVAEIFAPLTEALILTYVYKINVRFAFTAAILANLFSWSVGVYWS